MMNLRINKKRTALFLSVAVLLGMGTFVVDGNSRGNAAIKEKEVLGKAQIIVYKKGEKILIDPDAPYFKELQLACEEMLVPVPLKGEAPPAYLYHHYSSDGIPFPTLEQLENDELTIKVVYEKDVKTTVEVGKAPTIYLSHSIALSGFLIPLSGEWAQRPRVMLGETYFYTYLYLYSNLRGRVSTTRSPEKIRDILSEYMLVP